MIEVTGRSYAAPWTAEDRAILLNVPWLMIETDKRDAETMLQGKLTKSPDDRIASAQQ